MRGAEAWAEAHALTPGAHDSFRCCFVAIDVQNMFCIPGFELFVVGRSGTGAVDDTAASASSSIAPRNDHARTGQPRHPPRHALVDALSTYNAIVVAGRRRATAWRGPSTTCSRTSRPVGGSPSAPTCWRSARRRWWFPEPSTTQRRRTPLRRGGHARRPLDRSHGDLPRPGRRRRLIAELLDRVGVGSQRRPGDGGGIRDGAKAAFTTSRAGVAIAASCAQATAVRWRPS